MKRLQYCHTAGGGEGREGLLLVFDPSIDEMALCVDAMIANETKRREHNSTRNTRE